MIAQTMSVKVQDFTGQISYRASEIPRTASVYELLESISGEIQLPNRDAQGRPILYGARSANGEMLNPTDLVGDVLQDEEEVTLTKSVTAG